MGNMMELNGLKIMVTGGAARATITSINTILGKKIILGII